MHDRFRRFATRTAALTGSPWTFVLALTGVLAWLGYGPVAGWSDGWQLSINSPTTVVTFLQVLVIQSTANRDMRALHLKLDELLYAVDKARDDLAGIEQASDEQVAALREGR